MNTSCASYRFSETEKHLRKAISNNDIDQVRECIDYAKSQKWISCGTNSLRWACQKENSEIIQAVLQWRLERSDAKNELFEEVIASRSIKSLNEIVPVFEKHGADKELLNWASELSNCTLKQYKVLLNRYTLSPTEMNTLFRACLWSENLKIASYLCGKISFEEVDQERQNLFETFFQCVQLQIGDKTGRKLLNALETLSEKEAKILSSYGHLYKSGLLEDVLDRSAPETDFKNYLFVAAYRMENKEILHKILQRMPDTSLVVSFFENRLEPSAQNLLQLCVDEHNALKYKEQLTNELSEMKEANGRAAPKRKI